MDHNIDIAPFTRDLFKVFYGQLELKTTRTPMCDAARYLLASGLAKPEDRLVSTMLGAPSMTGNVGWLAKHTVVEGEDRPRFVKWRPFPAVRSDQGTAKSPSPGI